MIADLPVVEEDLAAASACFAYKPTFVAKLSVSEESRSERKMGMNNAC
jgi:hypothetical protein